MPIILPLLIKYNFAGNGIRIVFFYYHGRQCRQITKVIDHNIARS